MPIGFGNLHIFWMQKRIYNSNVREKLQKRGWSVCKEMGNIIGGRLYLIS